MAITKKTFIDPPPINECLATILFVVNIFLPGVGTMIVGFIKCSCESFFVGLLQMLVTVLFVGWVWSIWWGWDLMKISRQTVQIPNDVARDLLPVDAGQA